MKYFGTDGFRGRANQELTVDYALKIGQFMAWYFGKDKSEPVRCVIGKDTRLSSYMIEYGISATTSFLKNKTNCKPWEISCHKT